MTTAVECGRCGGPLFMATCHHFRGSGHTWVITSVCLLCRAVHWTDSGCLDCAALDAARASQRDDTRGAA